MRYHILSFALIACGLPAIAAVQQTSDFVFVVGKAETSAPPDVGILNAELIVESSPKALSTLKTQSTTLITEARKLGFGPQDIEGSEIGKSLRYSSQTKAVPTLSRKFSFRTRDLAAAVALFDKLGATAHLESLSIRFEVSRARDLDSKLLTLAVEDARARARQMATAVDREAGIAFAMSEEPFAEIDIRLGTSERERVSPAYTPPPEIDNFSARIPASIQFSKQVYVKFKLE